VKALPGFPKTNDSIIGKYPVSDKSRASASGIVVQEPNKLIEDLTAAVQQRSMDAAISDAPIIANNMAVIIKRDLAVNVTNDAESAVGLAMMSKYQVMKQNLRKLFANEDNIRDVSTQEELISQMNELLGKGLKVIVLDDGTLAKDLAAGAINKGKPGEDYCFVSSEPVEGLEKMDAALVNFNAMAYMGAGILNKNATLFRFAYKAFSGKDPEAGLVDQLMQGVQWIVRVLPRVIRFNAEDLNNSELLRKIFAVAA